MNKWHNFFSATNVQKIIDKILLPLFFVFVIVITYSIILIFASPNDYQQGNAVKIMYIHVPSAWLSLMIYSIIAVSSIFYLVWKNPVSHHIARNSAPIGACFAFITLATGSIWGKPIWGTWWVFDARLTSMLILFLFYLAYLALSSSISNHDKAAKSLAILAIIGFVNVPIVKFSVDFWNSLHQPASILRKNGPAIDKSMLEPLLFMFLACFIYYLLLVCIKTKTDFIAKKNKRSAFNRSY